MVMTPPYLYSCASSKCVATQAAFKRRSASCVKIHNIHNDLTWWAAEWRHGPDFLRFMEARPTNLLSHPPPTHFVIFIIVNIIVFIDIMSLHILFKILALNLKLSKAPHVCPQDTYLLHCFQKGSYFREHGSIGAFLTLWVPIGDHLYFKVPISRFWVNFNFINWRYRSRYRIRIS